MKLSSSWSIQSLLTNSCYSLCVSDVCRLVKRRGCPCTVQFIDFRVTFPTPNGELEPTSSLVNRWGYMISSSLIYFDVHILLEQCILPLQKQRRMNLASLWWKGRLSCAISYVCPLQTVKRLWSLIPQKLGLATRLRRHAKLSVCKGGVALSHSVAGNKQFERATTNSFSSL